MKGYPEFVSEPEPKSRETSNVFASTHVAPPFDSGRWNPPATKDFDSMSNSRIWFASLPPFESETKQRRCSGGRQLTPWYTQLAPSRFARSSTSRTVSQFGDAVR